MMRQGEWGECRQKMKQQFYDAIVDGPIIAAVKDETGWRSVYRMISAWYSFCMES